MSTDGQNLLLRDEKVAPTNKLLEHTLNKKLFAVYVSLQHLLSKFDLDMQWKFYKDGQAWLCKVVAGKKTVLWVSIWQDFIRTSFYFTEKTGPKIFDLDIEKNIKRDFKEAKPIGKLRPLVFDIVSGAQLDDLRTIIEYKKSLK